jgi:diaminohydroxyphosphoribosylaminopyrimidine deaminase / 5-amino-6-(5-phosphoribosylamino)uracil reductase
MVSDAVHMARALALAERGRGRTSPNPMVGAVVIDDEGVVVGRGWHAVAGGPHAEVQALTDAGPRAHGATLYCTLEPCSHTGRTPPCAPRVVVSGVRRVVVATADPNPLVAGRGLSHLRDHGVPVTVGVLTNAAERLNAPFFTLMRRRRPLVTMKVALSQDGYVGSRSGARALLTGATANRVIHRERAEVDAIAVGSGTVAADDPLLTPRGAYRHRPLVRVVFDRSLRTPVSARLLSTLAAGPIIVVAVEPDTAAAQQSADALAAAGARVEFIRPATGPDFLQNALIVLGEQGITSLMVEGGPTLHRAFWDAGLVDRVQIFRTPRSVGADGVSWLDANGVSPDRLDDLRTVRLGDDVMIEGYVHRAD